MPSHMEAVRLYNLAVDQGYAPAQCNLGLCYMACSGGIRKDNFSNTIHYCITYVRLKIMSFNCTLIFSCIRAQEDLKNCVLLFSLIFSLSVMTYCYKML